MDTHAMIERITDDMPEADRAGHEFRYRMAAGFIQEDDVVIDAACGTGYGAKFLRADQYVGVDRDISECEPSSAIRLFIDRNLETWEPPIEFDVGVCFETIEHLEDYSCLVRWLKRASKWIIVSVPVIPTVGINPWHVHDFEPGDIPRLFEDDEWGLYQAIVQPSEVAGIYVMKRR